MTFPDADQLPLGPRTGMIAKFAQNCVPLAMKNPCRILVVILCTALPAADANDAHDSGSLHASGERSEHAPNLWTGEGVNLAGIFFPDFHFQSVVGDSTAEPAELAVGHHDPDRRGVTIQNIELGLVARLGERFSIVTHYSVKIDLDDQWDDKLEEAYFRARELPGGGALRAGRLYARVGRHNVLHPHDFTFVDQHLINARVLGEDPLTLHGAEFSLPVARSLPIGWSDRITLAFGRPPEPEEGDAHAHHGGEDFSLAPAADTESSIPDDEADGESALHDGWTLAADYSLRREWDNSRAEIGASGSWGENRAGGDTQLYALHGEYLWQSGTAHEHHVDVHGHYVRLNGELWLRHWDTPAPGADSTFTDAGAWVALSYGFPRGSASAHLRGEYVSGVAAVELDERWRLSPAIMWRPTERVNARLVAQYNYDHFPTSRGNEHSFWLQLSFTWGSHID